MDKGLRKWLDRQDDASLQRRLKDYTTVIFQLEDNLETMKEGCDVVSSELIRRGYKIIPTYNFEKKTDKGETVDDLQNKIEDE